MRINWRSSLEGVIIIIPLIACAPVVTVTPLGAERTYSPTPDSVKVPLYSVAKPECPYDEIAAISAQGSTTSKVLPALRSKARALGGEAIIGYTRSRHESGDDVESGTAIHFRSRDCAR